MTQMNKILELLCSLEGGILNKALVLFFKLRDVKEPLKT